MNRPTDRPLETMARLGYGARGAVYCLVGGLAVLAALGSGGRTGGSRSALRSLLDEPFGKVLLAVVALGLACFAAWRIVEAITDADRNGSSGKGLAIRAAHMLSGAIYAGLALSAVDLALGWGGRGGDDKSARDWTAWLLDKPFGQWLVAIVGLGVIGTGLGYMWKAWRGDVMQRLAVAGDTRRWALLMGRLGFAARGVVFVLAGGFLVLAGLHGNSAEAKGLGGALKSLQVQPYGWVLLGLTAAGLFAFGVFGFVQARYRRIEAPDIGEAAAAAARGVRSLRP